MQQQETRKFLRNLHRFNDSCDLAAWLRANRSTVAQFLQLQRRIVCKSNMSSFTSIPPLPSCPGQR